MQIIEHKNTTLTVCERLFIEKSLEMLYLGTVDSYRVRINNPKTILEEIRYCLKEFQLGRIKHFATIKGVKDKKAISDEATTLITTLPTYLTFNSISQKYLEIQLTELSEYNYKKLISTIDILLSENVNYLENVVNAVQELISTCTNTFEELTTVDRSLNILYSELINKGYSKGFLYKLVYGIFVNTLENGRSFTDHFENFKQRILDTDTEYEVIFKIDTTAQVCDSISNLTDHPNISLSINIDDIALTSRANEFRAFNVSADARRFVRCRVKSLDYLSALKKGKSILSEYLDVVNLGLADEFLNIHNRVLVVDLRSPERGAFQNNFNILDGKYRVEKNHYLSFASKLPSILGNTSITPETKEKIKSAIRYLRLGNQSVEMEHKFINYWIGLEYLFSNYESSSTVNRLKDHFIAAHTLAYTKRNIHSFNKSFNQLSTATKSAIANYSADNNEYLKNEEFYKSVFVNLLQDYPLIAYRASKIRSWMFEKNPASGKKYIEKHKHNLEIHLTRIYRLRNEIIHDAATNTNNEQIASNLRYYLTFILNEIIEFLSTSTQTVELSIEDYFINNEIRLGNIEQKGSLLSDLLEVSCAIDFIS